MLAEHPAIAESAVVPSPDALRTSVAKAVVMPKPGHQPGAALAQEILEFVKQRVAPYKRIRRLEFAELPKTIRGKIRFVELRKTEAARVALGVRPPLDFGTE